MNIKWLLKNKLVLLLAVVFISVVTIYYKKVQDEWYTDPYITVFEKIEDNLSCHYLKEGDALPSAQHVNFNSRRSSIFFHETSCQGRLSSRQACAVESAARSNPDKDVFVLFSAPVNQFILKRSNLAKLKLYPNIKFARINITNYAEGTPLEDMVKNKPFQDSKWWIEHTSDILRCLTLYKWGGIYLDTDMIVTKSLTPLGDNWVAKEDDTLVNAAAIAISMDHIGRNLAVAFVNELSTTYKPKLWSYNGPGAITRVLHKICNTHRVEDWSADTCGGLQVYGPEYFYPIHYSNCRVLFEPGELDESEKNAYTYHLWNKITYNITIEYDSPYMKMAEKYCPMILDMYGDQFGS